MISKNTILLVWWFILVIVGISCTSGKEEEDLDIHSIGNLLMGKYEVWFMPVEIEEGEIVEKERVQLGKITFFESGEYIFDTSRGIDISLYNLSAQLPFIDYPKGKYELSFDEGISPETEIDEIIFDENYPYIGGLYLITDQGTGYSGHYLITIGHSQISLVPAFNMFFTWSIFKDIPDSYLFGHQLIVR